MDGTLTQIGKIIESLSYLAWPVIVVWMLYYFREAIRSIMESTKGRRITLKVAGNELTMEEVTDQQRNILADLQDKVAKLEEVYESSTAGSLSDEVEAEKAKVGKILWVDDRPKNNSFLVSTLIAKGLEVEIATTTKEAEALLKEKAYARIISDMGRPESDRAGINLLKYVRGSNPDVLKTDAAVPYFIYCGPWAAKNLKNEFLGAGGTGITTSSSSLIKMLNLEYDE